VKQELDIAVTAKLLGALLYYPPSSEEVTPLLTFLKTEGWIRQWPYGSAEVLAESASLIAQGVNGSCTESMDEAFQRLFIGPYALDAPPWGSVYLDKESVLFGESTLSFRWWLDSNGIDPLNQNNEPEDHIGLMLMMTAWLAEQWPILLDELLEFHLLTWAPRYFELLKNTANHPFYQGVAKLGLVTLKGWQEQRDLVITKQQLYR
jgi:TorA maturation chaperone TorD